MNRTLAAIHHQHHVKRLGERVEHHLVLRVERIRAHTVRLEVRLKVMPVDARPADGGRHAAMTRFIRHRRATNQLTNVTVHAVVIVEKTIAHPQHCLRFLGPGRCRRLHLRLRGRASAQHHRGARQQQRLQRLHVSVLSPLHVAHKAPLNLVAPRRKAWISNSVLDHCSAAFGTQVSIRRHSVNTTCLVRGYFAALCCTCFCHRPKFTPLKINHKANANSPTNAGSKTAGNSADANAGASNNAELLIK